MFKLDAVFFAELVVDVFFKFFPVSSRPFPLNSLPDFIQLRQFAGYMLGYQDQVQAIARLNRTTPLSGFAVDEFKAQTDAEDKQFDNETDRLKLQQEAEIKEAELTVSVIGQTQQARETTEDKPVSRGDLLLQRRGGQNQLRLVETERKRIIRAPGRNAGA